MPGAREAVEPAGQRGDQRPPHHPWGAVANLGRLDPGDLITVETASGEHAYQVAESLIVAPGDTWVTGQWDRARPTPPTCNPVFSAGQRLVVVSRLVAGPNAGVILGAR
ncbi:MAG TPA: sortase [Acidimicrobiia bacterium]|nr:sortase [Acidimicrobiia bacterium]